MPRRPLPQPACSSPTHQPRSDTLRLSTGIDQLDGLLGGGLLPGTLTVLFGSTGIGKTQLGLHRVEGARRSPSRGQSADEPSIISSP
ncbi:MAG: hypothetical protein HQ582_15990 [Planctomycetes bacterium]|nr:hypothetical protein [Planctomycetota bacterium]